MARAGGFLLVQQATLDACRWTMVPVCSTIYHISSSLSSGAFKGILQQDQAGQLLSIKARFNAAILRLSTTWYKKKPSLPFII